MAKRNRVEYNKIYFKKWYQKNKERRNEQSRAWYFAHKEFVREYQRKRYKKKLLPFNLRFWKYVDKRGENECWNWKGLKYPSGYGRMRDLYVHRISYELNVAQIPKGLDVCHSCDNTSCVNPKHLWVGTVADNMHDRDIKGRDRHSRARSMV